MKTDKFRPSENIEDYRDPTKPVVNKREAHESIKERLKLIDSQLAKDLGIKDI